MLKNLNCSKKTPSSRLKLISRNQFNNIKNYQKIIFQCQKNKKNNSFDNNKNHND